MNENIIEVSVREIQRSFITFVRSVPNNFKKLS